MHCTSANVRLIRAICTLLRISTVIVFTHPEVVEGDVCVLVDHFESPPKQQQCQGGHHAAVTQECAARLHLQATWVTIHHFMHITA